MNSRDRVLNTIRRRSVDRVPLDLWARPEVWDSLAAHFGVRGRRAVRKKLGIDVEMISVALNDPAFSLRGRVAPVPGSSTIAGNPAVAHGDGTYTDQWGVRYGLDPGLQVEHIVTAPFPESEFPSGYQWPDESGIEDAASLRQTVHSLHNEGFCVFGSILNPFKLAWQLRGFDAFLMDLCLAPTFARALMDRLASYSITMARRLAAAGADVLALVGDVAMQDRMLFSPAVFGSVVAPVFRRVIQETRASGSDAPFMFHSDGNIMPVIPDLIEAGFEVVNPIQPESMDPIEVKRLYGDRITLHGTISVQTTLPKGSEAEVRETVRRMIAECGNGGGLILSTTNDAMTDIPIRNLLAFYDEARRKV